MKKIMTLALVAVLGLGAMTGCETLGSGSDTMKGTGIGALGGAVVGGLWGAARGDWVKGAAIGAGVGAVAGGVTGAVMDKQAEDLRKAGIRAQKDANGNMIISMTGDTLKFATGKALINSDGEAMLTKLAGVLAKYPENRISVSGHTDNTGSADTNRSLSQQRADVVRAYLLSAGVPQRCILSSVGYGSDRPLASNATEVGRAANRRVELSVTVDQDEAKTNEAEREKYKNRNAQ